MEEKESFSLLGCSNSVQPRTAKEDERILLLVPYHLRRGHTARNNKFMSAFLDFP